MSIPDNNFINNVINEFVSGNKEKALKKLHKYIKKNDGDLQAKYNYAYMQHQVGNIKKAIQCYTEVAELSKTQWKSRQNLALIYLYNFFRAFSLLPLTNSLITLFIKLLSGMLITYSALRPSICKRNNKYLSALTK